MRLGLCCSAASPAGRLPGLDFLEENVQTFLCPRDGDEAAWQARLAVARSAGTPLLAANCFLPADLPCVGPVVDRSAIRVWAITAFRRAAEAGIRFVVFGSGGSRRIPVSWPEDRARAQLLDLLRELGPLAQAAGVLLALEPLNRGECNLVNSLAEGAALVRAAATPGVRLLADLYHMRREDEAPQAIRDAGDLLVHVHVAERDRRTPPGTAGDDFRPWLQALREIGYDRALSLECSAWEDQARQLPTALATLRRQWAACTEAALALR